MKIKISYYLEEQERNEIIELMKQKGVYIQEIAKGLNVGKSYIYNVLSGLRSIPEPKYNAMLDFINNFKAPSDRKRKAHIKPHL